MADETKAKNKAKEKKKKKKVKQKRQKKTIEKAPSKAKAIESKTSGGDDAESISVDKLLALLLAVSVIMNFYLFYQYNSLLDDAGRVSEDNTQQMRVVSGQAIQRPAIDDKVRVDFYVMSMCPYTSQVQTAINPVLEKMGDVIDFSINYIAQDTGSGFNSLRGQPEVDENIRQLCAMKNHGNGYEYMEYIICRNSNIQSDDWQSCARSADLDIQAIMQCVESGEGAELLRKSIGVSNDAQASGSPTMFINGQRYSGQRTERAFTQAICGHISNQHYICRELPPEKPIDIIVLNDRRCANCNIEPLKANLRQEFPAARFIEYDYSQDDGKRIYDESGIEVLPAILFGQDVRQTDKFGNMQRFLQDAGPYLNLMIGSRFDPKREICDNGMDDTGNGLIDCEDPDCEHALVCRQEIPKRLDAFVMSMCPFAITGLNSMDEVLEAIPDMDFNLHYIVGYDEDSLEFSSLSGQREVDENIRQLCAIDISKDRRKWMGYILCRNSDMNGDWMECADEAGIDADLMSECSTKQHGKDLLRQSMKTAQDLGITGSPTWMVSNKNLFSGISAEQIRSGFCRYNQDMPGCEMTLSDDTAGLPAQGGC